MSPAKSSGMGADGDDPVLVNYCEKKYNVQRRENIQCHIKAKVLASPSGARVRVVVSTNISQGAYLHWAVAPQGKPDWVWEVPSEDVFPESSEIFHNNGRAEAVHTDFPVFSAGGAGELVFDFDGATAPSSFNFVVKDRTGRWWDAGQGGYKVALPQLPVAEEAEVAETEAAGEDGFLNGIGSMLRKAGMGSASSKDGPTEPDSSLVEVAGLVVDDEVRSEMTSTHEIRVTVDTGGASGVDGERAEVVGTVWTDIPGDRLLLHWGVVPRGADHDAWVVPDAPTWPPNSRLHKDRALQSHFERDDSGAFIKIDLGEEDLQAFRFVIKDADTEMWFSDGGDGGDFFVPCPLFEDPDVGAELGALGTELLEETAADISREAKRVMRDLDASSNTSLASSKAVAEADARNDIAIQAAAAAKRSADRAKRTAASVMSTGRSTPGFNVAPGRRTAPDVVAIRARRHAVEARAAAKRALIAAEVAEVAAQAAERMAFEVAEADRKKQEERENFLKQLKLAEENAAAAATAAANEEREAIARAAQRKDDVAAAAARREQELEEQRRKRQDEEKSLEEAERERRAVAAAEQEEFRRAALAREQEEEAMRAAVETDEVAKELDTARKARKAAEKRLMEAKAAASASVASPADVSDDEQERAVHDMELEREREGLRRQENKEVAVNPGTGTGREILCQFFNWESSKENWYQVVKKQAQDVADMGFTVVWLPPPTDSVSDEGYMPRDLYLLESNYGSKQGLKDAVDELHRCGLKVLGDAVLNHRCAQFEKDGVWNQFGGKMAWDETAIVSDDPHFRGRGNHSNGDHFHAAPNIDHSQDFVRRDIKEWLCWLKEEIGYDGWRLDFVRGFSGVYVKEYLEASDPEFCVGEYWDSLEYSYGEMEYNQDAHRQRIIDWMNKAGGLSGAFDVTTKGILHEVTGKNEYWRLSDADGQPPGVLGWWPSRAVTFIENHDTGSTQAHWPFPSNCVLQGYCYLLTHPGTPTVFYDHIYHWDGLKEPIKEMMAIRRDTGVHCRSQVKIIRADDQMYAAQIDNRLVMKIGPGHFEPDLGQWEHAASGDRWTIWKAK